MTHYKKVLAVSLCLLVAISSVCFFTPHTYAQEPDVAPQGCGTNGVWDTSANNGQGGCVLTYQPLEPLPSSNQVNYSDLSSYLNYLFPILIAITATFAVVMFAVNGVRYMLSEASITDKQKAQTRIRASLWGMLLILVAVLLLHTINPQLTNFSLKSLGQFNTQSAQ